MLNFFKSIIKKPKLDIKNEYLHKTSYINTQKIELLKKMIDKCMLDWHNQIRKKLCDYKDLICPEIDEKFDYIIFSLNNTPDDINAFKNINRSP